MTTDNSGAQSQGTYNRQEITSYVMNNLDGFDQYNWLAFVNKPVAIDELAGIAACSWHGTARGSDHHRDVALECGCIGITLAAYFYLDFATAYLAIAYVFKEKYGEGFWQKGFAYPLGSPERAVFYSHVKMGLDEVLDNLEVEWAQLPTLASLRGILDSPPPDMGEEESRWAR